MNALNSRKLILVIDECAKLIARDIKNFKEIIKQLVSTQHLKIILIPNEEKEVDFDCFDLQNQS